MPDEDPVKEATGGGNESSKLAAVGGMVGRVFQSAFKYLSMLGVPLITAMLSFMIISGLIAFIITIISGGFTRYCINEDNLFSDMVTTISSDEKWIYSGVSTTGSPIANDDCVSDYDPSKVECRLDPGLLKFDVMGSWRRKTDFFSSNFSLDLYGECEYHPCNAEALYADPACIIPDSTTTGAHYIDEINSSPKCGTGFGIGVYGLISLEQPDGSYVDPNDKFDTNAIRVFHLGPPDPGLLQHKKYKCHPQEDLDACASVIIYRTCKHTSNYDCKKDESGNIIFDDFIPRGKLYFKLGFLKEDPFQKEVEGGEEIAGSVSVGVNSIPESSAPFSLKPFVELITNVFLDSAKQLQLKVFKEHSFQNIVRMMMVLYVVVFALAILLGLVQLHHGQIILMLIKIIFVSLAFSDVGIALLNNIFFELPRTIAQQMGMLVARGAHGSLGTVSGDLDFNDSLVFVSMIDILLGLIFDKAIYLKILALVTSILNGYLISLLSIILLPIILLAFYNIFLVCGFLVMVYIHAIFMFSFFIFTLPFFLPFILFNVTKRTFDQWLKLSIGSSIQYLLSIVVVNFIGVFLLYALSEAFYFKVCKYVYFPFKFMKGVTDVFAAIFYALSSDFNILFPQFLKDYIRWVASLVEYIPDIPFVFLSVTNVADTLITNRADFSLFPKAIMLLFICLIILQFVQSIPNLLDALAKLTLAPMTQMVGGLAKGVSGAASFLGEQAIGKKGLVRSSFRYIGGSIDDTLKYDFKTGKRLDIAESHLKQEAKKRLSSLHAKVSPFRYLSKIGGADEKSTRKFVSKIGKKYTELSESGLLDEYVFNPDHDKGIGGRSIYGEYGELGAVAQRVVGDNVTKLLGKGRDKALQPINVLFNTNRVDTAIGSTVAVLHSTGQILSGKDLDNASKTIGNAAVVAGRYLSTSEHIFKSKEDRKEATDREKAKREQEEEWEAENRREREEAARREQEEARREREEARREREEAAQQQAEAAQQQAEAAGRTLAQQQRIAREAAAAAAARERRRRQERDQEGGGGG